MENQTIDAMTSVDPNYDRCVEIGKILPTLEKERSSLRTKIEKLEHRLNTTNNVTTEYADRLERSMLETEHYASKLRLEGLNAEVSKLIKEHADLGGTRETMPFLSPADI